MRQLVCARACSSGEVTRSACVAALSLTVACAARHAIVEAECRGPHHNLQKEKPFDAHTLATDLEFLV